MTFSTLGPPLPPKRGHDVPPSGGKREAAKFRESVYIGLDTVAVVQDDGQAIGTVLIPILERLIVAVDRLRFAMQVSDSGLVADLGDFDETHRSVAPLGHVEGSNGA